ncbi:MAG TPA: NUDIX hydrolase [Planctomycetota bacterium]|jgi:8-oxo-dGTP pyrophosphatase MutT (NUDIX family)
MNAATEPLKHGVVAVLQDEAGRFLFIRRAMTLKRAPGWWCFVGGEVEPGESFPDAIRREVREEVGIVIRPLDEIHQSISPNGEFRLHWLRIAMDPPNQNLVLEPAEVAEARWLNVSEALKLNPCLPALITWLGEQ